MTLNPKQEQFCQEYIIDLNGTQAAIRTGYSAKTANAQASRLLTDVNIKNRIDELLAMRSKRTEITADYVLKSIVEVIERCRQVEPVLDKMGSPTGEYQFEANPALKGLELLGKHLKLFTDKVEHGGEVAIKDISSDPIEQTSEEWLEKAKSTVGLLNKVPNTRS